MNFQHLKIETGGKNNIFDNFRVKWMKGRDLKIDKRRSRYYKSRVEFLSNRSSLNSYSLLSGLGELPYLRKY